MFTDDEFFGSPERIALAKRSANLWSLLQDNPRYSYYGRLVALSDPGQDAAEILSAMARLQGGAVSYFYPVSAAERLLARLADRGLTTDRHEHLWGGETALAASRRALQDVPLPADLIISAVDERTPRELIREVAELCQSCDVMPVRGSIMRGQARKGICLVATDQRQ